MLILVLSLVLLLFPIKVHAIYDPLSMPNNPYGMHIVEYNDIPELPSVINTNGGDWGYVTIVLSDRDHDHGKIQRIFDQMRREHLIPIVRLATRPDGDRWLKPSADNYDKIVTFLSSLNWPIENRYVVLYNEPNHANEWGGDIDPEGYAKTIVDLGKKLKQASTDFFILPAGLDVSAASDSKSLNASDYLKRMVQAQPEFLHTIDGWTSHSYPNPGFSGSPYASGRGTLTSYSWELDQLKATGLTKQLPVFITETGWIHAEGKTTKFGAYSSEAVGKNLEIASQAVWKDPRIAAITPFVYNYQDVPFDNFSWKLLGNTGFYPFVESYKNILKKTGRPQQRESYDFLPQIIPPALVVNSSYTLTSQLNNLGQGIVDDTNGYGLELSSDTGEFGFLSDPLPIIEPFEKQPVTIHIRTPHATGTYTVTLSLKHDALKIPLQIIHLQVVPPPSISISTKLVWASSRSATDIKVIIYDESTIIHEFHGLSMKSGVIDVPNLTGVIPNKKYRVVVIVPSYLPRQSIGILRSKNTSISMKRLYPLDLNHDGAFTAADLFMLVKSSPYSFLRLFISL